MRMMRIVVDDGKSIYLTLLFEPAVGSGKMCQSHADGVHGDAIFQGNSDGCQRIVYIVLTCHTERQALFLLTVDIKIEGRMRVIVILDITGTVIVAAAVTKSNNLAFCRFYDLLIVLDIAVDDNRALGRYALGKQLEGMTDVRQILEEIEMVFFYIKDDRHRRVEG